MSTFDIRHSLFGLKLCFQSFTLSENTEGALKSNQLIIKQPSSTRCFLTIFHIKLSYSHPYSFLLNCDGFAVDSVVLAKTTSCSGHSYQSLFLSN